MNFKEHCEECRAKLGRPYGMVHIWLDAYDGKKGRDKDGEYDYTGINCIKHREKRHHNVGIMECEKHFFKKYEKRLGREFAEKIIPQIVEAAELHIISDMGYIPAKEEYENPWFWRKSE